MASFFVTQPTALGLDIGDTSVKVALLSKQRRGTAVEQLFAAALPDGLIVDGEIRDLPAAAAALKHALTPVEKFTANGVMTILPESKTFLETIAVPKQGDATLEARLREVPPEHLPLQPEDSYQDSAVVAETPNAWHVTVGATPRDVADNYIKLFGAAGVLPLAFDLPALATARAIMPESLAEQPFAILDLGRHRTSMIVCDRGAVQFTIGLPGARDEVTNAVAAALDITVDQAEKAKITCGLDPVKCEGVLREVLTAETAELVKKITEARDFYQNRFPSAKDISTVLLCGGGAHLPSLDATLSESLHLPVSIANLWQNAGLLSPRDIDAPLRFASAVGLALRGLEGSRSL